MGGDFDTVHSGTDYHNVARWSGSSWSRVGYYAACGVDNTVLAMTRIGNTMHFGGDALKAGSGSVNYFAKRNRAASSPLGRGLSG